MGKVKSMSHGKNLYCPVEKAGMLDNTLRKWLQNPHSILQPYITEGMTVLDIGCGPGFFTLELAQLVGKCGQVIAADFQEGMLQIVRGKIAGTALEERITLHQCAANKIGVSTKVDFMLAFYMVHEIPDQAVFFTEIAAMLKPNGRVLIVEPAFHVSNTAFAAMMNKARDAGFISAEKPKVLLSRAVVLKKG